MPQDVSPFLRSMCRRFIQEEPGLWPKMMQASEADILAVAMPRVMAVVTGEVKWKQATKGERAVWQGRSRNPELAHKRVHSYMNVYDSLLIVPHMPDDIERAAYASSRGFNLAASAPSSWKIFNNSNVGYQRLSNMQVGGQLACERDFVIDQMYAVTDRTISANDNIVVTLSVGHGPVRILPLHDWCMGIVGGDFVIPIRQTFGVCFDIGPHVSAPLEVRIHLEGWLGGAERTKNVGVAATFAQPPK